MSDSVREAFDSIESEVAQGAMTAAQVFTQMKQLVQTALSANGGEAMEYAIDEAIESGGWWASCSGCHETNEGVSDGPRSIFGCHAGIGCDECGGIGVIWHEAPTDEQIALLSAHPDTRPAPPSVAVPEQREWNQVTGRDGFKYTEGWNACREAMLAAAPSPDHSGDANKMVEGFIEDQEPLGAEFEAVYEENKGELYEFDDEHIADAGKVVASSWKSAKNDQHWPHIGGKYLIKLNGVLQHEIYEFDQGDDGMGGGEYFWDREDLDEAAPFNPEKDEWLPINEAGTATPSVPENEIKARALEQAFAQLASEYAPYGLRNTYTAFDVSQHIEAQGKVYAARLRTAGDEGEA